MMALIILPLAERAHHELGHITEEHCGFEGLHYCETEHHCEVCDFIFSANITPPDVSSTDINFLRLFIEPFLVTDSSLSGNSRCQLFLRGPPATALS